MVEAALLLEESRVAAAQIRRRPDDRAWLRASATEIVIGDNGGADAAAQIPPTAYAHNAALLLGRVDGGITASECAPAAKVIESTLGSDKLEGLREIWQAHTVADTDRMVERGQRWLDLVGPDTHADPDPNSPLAGRADKCRWRD